MDLQTKAGYWHNFGRCQRNKLVVNARKQRPTIKLSRNSLTSSTFTSDEIGQIPSELQFLLDQLEVDGDLSDSCTELEFKYDEI